MRLLRGLNKAAIRSVEATTASPLPSPITGESSRWSPATPPKYTNVAVSVT